MEKWDDPPSPFISQLHHFHIKKHILKMMRKEQCTVKTQVRNDGLTYGIFVYAKLQVTVENKQTLVFLSAAEVSLFFQNSLRTKPKPINT